MRRVHQLVRRDDGAVAVLYAIVFTFVLMPLLAIGTTTLVRSTTTGELQRAADAGSLAGAAAIPFGDVNFARIFLDKTAAGPTDQTLRDLGLSYPGQDPLITACEGVALRNATDPSEVGRTYADAPSCTAQYLSDPDTLEALRTCADGLVSDSGSTGGLPSAPDLSPLLPALLYPGVKVSMSWHVNPPMGSILGGKTTTESVTSIAHRRFKNMVVVPEATLPTGTTINLNPYAGDVRSLLLDAIDGTERLLAANPATAECATVLDAAHDDIVDAIAPPTDGPSFNQILDDAIASRSPLIVAQVVTAADALGVPFLDFVPVCADYVAGHYVGHLTNFGSCSVSAPGAFRASLRRS